MEYVELITRAAYRSTVEDVQKLREVGWKEEQISEAVYITSLFAFFNRVADAFGIPAQDYLATGKLTPRVQNRMSQMATQYTNQVNREFNSLSGLGSMRCGLCRRHGQFCGHHAVHLQLVYRASGEVLWLAP